MSSYAARPRILFITPEAAFIPQPGGRRKNAIGAGAYGFGDFPTAFISDLFHANVDVYVAQPDYRRLLAILARNAQARPDFELPSDHLYLAKDRVFYYANLIERHSEWENIKVSLAFQREVINQIIPRVRPDLIHCYDWMTGLIPAAAKTLAIPCLFTVLKIDSVRSTLSYIEDIGIDAAGFWQNLFYEWYPGSYEQTRDTNRLDLLLSGILSASHVTIDRSGQWPTTAHGPDHTDDSILRQALVQKYSAGCASSHLALAHPSARPGINGKMLHACEHFDQRAEQQKSDLLKEQSIPPLGYRTTSQTYMDLYEMLLHRPLTTPDKKKVNPQHQQHQAYASPFIARAASPVEPLFSL